MERQNLYLDGLNFTQKFFSVGKHLDDHWQVLDAEPRRKVIKFIEGADYSNYRLKVFFHSTGKINSETEKENWRRRREKEIRDGAKRVMYGSAVLLGDLFREYGVDICYCADAGCDDTIATYAVLNNAFILSDNKQYFKFRGANYRLFSDFEYDIRGGLVLIEKERKVKYRDLASRPLLQSVPNVSSTSPIFQHVVKYKEYTRGVPVQNLANTGENPHITVRPLRQALYCYLGINEPIKETFPTWNAEKGEVEWVEEMVQPDGQRSELLSNPLQSVKELFPNLDKRTKTLSLKDFKNYLYAVTVVCSEICAVFTNSTLLQLLDSITPMVFQEYGINKSSSKKSDDSHSYCCTSCSEEVIMPRNEVQWYREKKFNMPKKCKQCRKRRTKGDT